MRGMDEDRRNVDDHGEHDLQQSNTNHDEAFKFIYFSRLFERYRDQYKIIIPIAIFTSNTASKEQDRLSIEIPGHSILHFQFLKVELRNHQWRLFINSDNPVAAALLGTMGYNKKEKREMRFEYLRMLLRLRHQLDDARLALVMSIGDLYFKPNKEEDHILLEQLRDQYAEEGAELMELMPAWKKWGYEEGIEEGMEKGIEKGLEKGKEEIIRKFLNKGFSPEVVAETVGASVEEIRKLTKS